MLRLLYIIPKNHLSYFVGWFVHLRLPAILTQSIIGWFVKQYRVDLSELTQPLNSFRSLGEFFVRDVRPESRPIGSGVISPVDGTIRGWAEIKDGQLEQIKGKSYSLESFVGDSAIAQRFMGGSYANLYLAPHNYHQIHSAFDAEIEQLIYIPGKLWPVNDWSINSIDDLFAINERVVIVMKSPFGRCALVAVGATNVGRIRVLFDELETNRDLLAMTLGARHIVSKRYDPARAVVKGEKLAVFEMGSSVVMLMEKGWGIGELKVALGSEVKVGQSLAELET